MLSLLSSKESLAQPTVLYTSLSSTNPASINNRWTLTTPSIFRQFRFQANQSGNFFWAFSLGTPTSPDYSVCWRPYTSGNAMIYNTFIPAGWADGARYNTSNGGADGEINNIQNGYYYTFNVGMNAAADNVMEVLETSYDPTQITSCTSTWGTYGQRIVTIVLAAAPQTGENVYMRYTTAGINFPTSTYMQVNMVGNTGTAIIPAQAATSTVHYYAYTSNRTKAAIDSDVASYGQAAHDMASLVISGIPASYSMPAGPIVVTSTGGTQAGNAISYATLQAAFTAINGGTLHLGTISIAVLGNTTETGAAVLNQVAGVTSVGIQPAGGVSRTITGAINNNPIIDLNGADNVSIDGRDGGSGSTISLTISNTHTGGFALRFINDAKNNLITFCNLLASSTSNGIVYFSTRLNPGGGTGNDNNTLSYCNIGPSVATYPLNCIYSSGSATPNENNNNSIINCNIYNFMANADHSGILISSGNSAWTIDGNSIYQTSSYAGPGSFTASGIRVNNATAGNNFIIRNNYIGGNSPNCGGSWVVNGTAQPYLFQAIKISAGSNNIIENNVIKGFSWLSSSTSGSTGSLPGVWTGIYLNNSGDFVVGNPGKGNIIGNNSNGSVSVTTTATGALAIVGIGSESQGNVLIQNNTIGSLTAKGSSTSISSSMIGILVTRGSNSIVNNTIGSNVLNSLNDTTAGTNNGALQYIKGIVFGGNYTVSTNQIISQNTISNLNNNYLATGNGNGSQNRGISIEPLSPANLTGNITIQSNTIKTITTAQNATTQNSGNPPPNIAGIYMGGSFSPSVNISGNSISNLTENGGSAAVNVTGIYFNGLTTGGNHIISKNFIYELSVPASSSTSSAIYGIRTISGTCIFSNNIVSISSNSIGALAYGLYDGGGNNNYYHNTVVCTGASGLNVTDAAMNTTTGNTRNIRNNVFYCTRGGNGTHRAVNVSSTSGLNIDWNDYTGTLSANLGVGGANSLTTPPSLPNPAGTVVTDYIPGVTTLTGTNLIATIPDDIDGTSRCVPTMGAQEVRYPPQPSSFSGNTSPCYGSNQVYSVASMTGVTFTWTLPAGWSIISGQGSNSITVVAGSGSGNILVTPSLTSTSCGDGPSLVIPVSPITVPDQPGPITGNTIPCWGTSQVYSVPSIAGVVYNWSFPGGWSQTAGGTTNTVTVTAGSLSGTIMVIPSNTCGNGIAQSISVTAGTLTVVSDPDSAAFCPGGSVTLSASGATNYTWSPATGLSGTTGASVSASPLETTTYTVTGTDINSCTGSATAVITVYPLPLAITIANTQIFRGSSINIGGITTPGNIYSWSSNPAGFTSNIANPSVAPLVNTTYTLVETNPVTGCTNTNSVNITVTDNLTITKSISSFPAFMPGEPIQYTITIFNTNEDSIPAQNVEIKDYLPPATLFTYVSASETPSSIAGNIITWNSSTLPVLANFVGSYSIVINGICGSLGNPNWPLYDPNSYYIMTGGGIQTISNNASIFNTGMSSPIYIPAPENMDIEQFCDPVLQPDTANGYIKSSTPSFIYFVFTITNNGNITDNFILNVNANLPPSAVNLTFSIQTLAGVPITQTGWLQPGESFSFLVRADCPGGTNPNLGNYSLLTASSTVCGNSDSSPIIINTYGGQISGDECDLQITKVSSVNPVTVGTNFTYTITVSNSGNEAEDVTLFDYLPSSLTYVSSTYSTSVAGATVSLAFNPGTNVLTGIYQKSPHHELRNGEYFEVNITVTPSCGATPEIQNHAIVTTSSEDLDYSNNDIFVTTQAESNITPPSISPAAPLLCSGQSITITASLAAAGYGYKWYDAPSGGNLLLTGNPYTTPVLIATTTYYAAIYNLLDTVCESARIPVVITVFSVPVVDVNPENDTVCENETATFSILATGTNPLSCKWQVDTGSGFTDIINGGIYSGATTSTLIITGVPAAMNGYLYRCLVQSGTCGYLTTSNTATLLVNENPLVSVNSAVKCENDPPVIIAATIMQPGTYSYVWTVPSGATNPGNVASFSATVAGTYSVVVTNQSTLCSGSGSGTITVNLNPVTSAVYHF